MKLQETDVVLVTQVKLFGSHKAFEKLVNKYQSKVRQLFMGLTLRDYDLSNDLAQETFIKAYLHLAQFKATAKFSTWLFRIAYNIFLDYKKTRRPHFVDTLPENHPQFAYQQAMQHEQEWVHLLRILKEEEKEVIVLSYIEEMSHKEIAEVLDMPIGTVKTHIKRGREKLVQYLQHKTHENRA